MSHVKKRGLPLLTFALAVITVGGILPVGVATEAHAAVNLNGVCEPGEFCYYYFTKDFPGGPGSVADFTGSVPDLNGIGYGCYRFGGPGWGQGACVKNNANSVWNRSSQTVRVYWASQYNTNYPWQDIPAGANVNLNSSLMNNNASHQFLPLTRLVRPMTGTDIGYAGDTGLDISALKGTKVYAVADATIEYSEFGHTTWKTPPDTPGSINIRLDTPITVNGTVYRNVFYTHLSSLVYSKTDGSSKYIHVNKGDLIGYSGLGNKVPHLHIAFYTDRSNTQKNLSMEATRALFGSYYGMKWTALQPVA